MNPSTASNRLVKDLLFKFAIESGHKCFQCGEDLCRDTFSIEHKEPWLDAENPLELYFDLNNIAFSHKVCNFSASRKSLSHHGTKSKYNSGCRCSPCTEATAKDYRNRYTSESRRERYLRNKEYTPKGVVSE